MKCTARGGGSGGMLPIKILEFRPYEIISGAILGQNSSTMDDLLPLTATASYPGYTRRHVIAQHKTSMLLSELD